MTPPIHFRRAVGAAAIALCLPIALCCLPIKVLAETDRTPESHLRRPGGVSIDTTETMPARFDVAAERPVRLAAASEPLEMPSPTAPFAGRMEASDSTDALAVRLAPREGDAAAAVGRTGLSGMVGGPLPTIVGALAVTLGVFAVFVALSRRAGGGSGVRTLPREAFEVIGQTSIGARQKLMVVRCGMQALVIGVSPAGIQRVAQIDDPDEAGQLIAACRSLGSTTAFRNTLRELEKEPAAPGFVDDAPQRSGRGNLFLRA